MTVVAMSRGELSRYDTLLRVTRRELRVEDAATLLGLTRRQVGRLLLRLRAEGPEGLVSRRRGRPSNRRHSDAFRQRVITLVREHYADFGPTLAAEYLSERHQITISHETLRKLMIEAGLWSELMHLRMVESENTFAYMDAMTAYIEAHGKPVAIYSDKHGVFRNNTASAKGDGMTHFGRSLEALNIEIICANSPQAKGRVERANGTLQDRLVKAMRLEGISTIAEANAFLPGYMARHNQRFAKAPFDPRDVHRPLAPHDDLKAEMVWREQRTVTQALTLHYNKALIILEPTEVSRPLAGKRVDVCEYPDGRLEIRHEEHVLPYRVFDKIRQVNQAAIVENKHLDAALAMAKAMQELLPPRKRNNNEPCRRSQGAHMFPPPQPQEGAPVKRKRGRPPLPRLTPNEAAQRMLESV
ncbi:ISNCY family transposase [Novosphingobium sp. PASSN1]|uniref:ISNCY family transposase n=1 Tax=Novosphingobium sp. PASSN1 TaxID=2015561 RepID=UPI000BC8FFBB|nr:ISNCY family transposase [Novosphingobium sp. PASSN1]OYU37273.1 MAG: ISNCY family transposase [Novosphingobium sp. PASSN1]